mmetsp:Transcript_129300/g.249442  ORF Transcript_129300/g.249442 Transcript_129300/m.249442 type:complete len:215 (-) Transcript_129300:124-768(-)
MEHESLKGDQAGGNVNLDFITSSIGQSVQQEAAKQVTEGLVKNAAERATGFLKMGAGEISVYIEKNHYSVNALSLMGGLALTSVSFLGLLNIFAPLFGPLSYLLKFYQLSIGLTICILDGPGEKLPKLQGLIVNYAPFLHNNFGRSLFYLFIACLEGTQDSWIHMLVGWYFVAIAVMFMALKFKNWRNGDLPEDQTEARDVQMKGDVKMMEGDV